MAGTTNLSKRLTYEARRLAESEARSVTQSRLLGLVRWSRATGHLFAAGARRYDSVVELDYREFLICRAVQAWQLTPTAFATAWIDAAREGIFLFPTEQQAREKFHLLVAALAAQSEPSPEDETDEGDTDGD